MYIYPGKYRYIDYDPIKLFIKISSCMEIIDFKWMVGTKDIKKYTR